MRKLFACAAAAGCLLASVSVAQARSAYDGSWDLVFVTERGACDATYNFAVNVTDGIVTHPNLVRFRGYVARSGAVRASVTVHDKFASGSGRLSSNSGRGTWSGHSGNSRCSGHWTAQRN
jgi:hypothetical protein